LNSYSKGFFTKLSKLLARMGLIFEDAPPKSRPNVPTYVFIKYKCA